MRFKLYENFGSRCVDLFQESGHDVETVLDEKLSGASDEVIFETYIREKRCLLSLDLELSDVVRFPPGKTEGMAILRLPRNASLQLMERFVSRMCS